MNEIELILEMAKQTFYGRAWHGPSLMEALKGIDKACATERLIEGRHTIWEITDHCSFWMRAVTQALEEERLPAIESDEDWSTMGRTDEDWGKAQEQLKKSCDALIDSIKGLAKDQLTKTLQGSYNGHPYTITYRRMLHGIAHHNTYHAGQITLLRQQPKP
jgi:uncharacterized damage-inducible protein DinB